MANREQNSKYIINRIKISFDEFCKNSWKFYKQTKTKGLKTKFMLHMQETHPEIAFYAKNTKKTVSNGYHDWDIVNMLFVLKDLVESEKNASDKYIKKEHFEQLKNSGLVLQRNAHKIKQLAIQNPDATFESL